MPLFTFQSAHNNKGIVVALRLELHGTQEMPDHVQRAGGRRHYNYQYNDIQNTRAVSYLHQLAPHDTQNDVHCILA